VEFKSGILSILNMLKFLGGHIIANSILGEILLWRKVQKNLVNSIISDRINIIILYFNIFIITIEWFPWSEASRFKSRHQRNGIRVRGMIIKIIMLVFRYWVIKLNISRIAEERI